MPNRNPTLAAARDWPHLLRRLETGERAGVLESLRTGFPNGAAPKPVDGDVQATWELLVSLDPDRAGEVTRPDWLHADHGADPGWRVAVTLRHLRLAVSALERGQVETLVRHGEAAIASCPAGYPWLQIRLGSLLQAAYRFSSRRDLYDAALAACAEPADRLDTPWLAITARGIMGTLYLVGGDLHSTIDICEAAIELAERSGPADHPTVALAHQFRGYVLVEWNRVDEAERELRRAWELTTAGSRGVRSGVARVMSLLCATTGRIDEAERWLSELEEVVSEPMTLRNREWLAAVRVGHDATRADLRAIDDWCKRYDYRADIMAGKPPAELRARLQEYDRFLTMLETTQQWAALKTAAEALHGAAEDRLWFSTRALTCLAVAYEGLGHEQEADRVWARALSEGERASLVRTYLDGSNLRRRLTRRAARDENVARYAARVQRAAPESFEDLSNAVQLSPTQLKVLQLVARGLSNGEIAARLHVRLTTVKTHLRAVYRLLRVKSRTGAVAVARETGLLP